MGCSSTRQMVRVAAVVVVRLVRFASKRVLQLDSLVLRRQHIDVGLPVTGEA
jgi:hypothetical protein